MIRYGAAPVVVVLNNSSYAIEVLLHDNVYNYNKVRVWVGGLVLMCVRARVSVQHINEPPHTHHTAHPATELGLRRRNPGIRRRREQGLRRTGRDAGGICGGAGAGVGPSGGAVGDRVHRGDRGLRDGAPALRGGLRSNVDAAVPSGPVGALMCKLIKEAMRCLVVGPVVLAFRSLCAESFVRDQYNS